MYYTDDGSDATIGGCGHGSSSHGDFQIVIDNITLDEFIWSNANTARFLANEEEISQHIEGANNSIDTQLDPSTNDDRIHDSINFVATLETGYITNVDELMEWLRVYQAGPPMAEWRLSELQEHFDVIIINQ